MTEGISRSGTSTPPCVGGVAAGVRSVADGAPARDTTLCTLPVLSGSVPRAPPFICEWCLSEDDLCCSAVLFAAPVDASRDGRGGGGMSIGGRDAGDTCVLAAEGAAETPSLLLLLLTPVKACAVADPKGPSE